MQQLSPLAIGVTLMCACMFTMFGVLQIIRLRKEYRASQLIRAEVLACIAVFVLAGTCVGNIFVPGVEFVYGIVLTLNVLLSNDKFVRHFSFLRKPILPKSHDERRFP